MRRMCAMAAVIVGLSAATAGAKAVGISAAPNPATIGAHVRHTVTVGIVGRLDVWVSARGFEQPGTGTLPAGTWSLECCPSQVAGTPAWHYRSSGLVPPGPYRFGAAARGRGTFLSTATVSGASASVSIRIV